MATVAKIPPVNQTIYPDPIPGIIPFGTVNLFAGASGAGKTSILVDVFLPAWITGGQIGPWTVPKLDTYWLSSDRVGGGTLRRMERVGIADAVRYYDTYAPDPKFPEDQFFDKRWSPWTGAVTYCFNKLSPKPGSILVLDPATPMFVFGDSNKTKDVTRSMRFYNKLCQNRKITLILIGHFAKQSMRMEDRYERPQDRIAGSNSFGGYTETQMTIIEPGMRYENGDNGQKKMTHEPYWTLGVVPRENKAIYYAFARDQDGTFMLYGESAFQEPLPEHEIAGMERCQTILTMMPDDQWIRFSDLVEPLMAAWGLQRSQVYQYRAMLINKGFVNVSGTGRQALIRKR
ncbi:MAG TPA: AAA family ATPase, partial [Pseudonocardiaceae bacterium]|nr:AAA family ATPase [Pseudonocardiaceae bacterium]